MGRRGADEGGRGGHDLLRLQIEVQVGRLIGDHAHRLARRGVARSPQLDGIRASPDLARIRRAADAMPSQEDPAPGGVLPICRLPRPC